MQVWEIEVAEGGFASGIKECGRGCRGSIFRMFGFVGESF